jgi:glycosyltransferase involved in cell wall biosynthesis
MIRRALRGAKALFADGDELAEKVTSICGRECHFLPSFHRFNYKIMPMPREKYFLFLGRLEKSKGIFDLLKAFKRIKEDIWDYRLLIIGAGSRVAEVSKMVNSHKLRGKVHLLGRLPSNEVINYLQRARALVIPTHSDSIPLVFGEALQTKTPMIVTNVGDLGELVRDNKLGFAVQKKSPRALADAMVKMIVSEVDITAGAENLMTRLSPETAAKRFLEVASAAQH